MNTKLDTTDKLLNLNNVMFSISHSNHITEPGAPALVGPHVHNCYEIYVNLSGNISFLVNNSIYKISSGDMVFSKPGDVHHCICNETCLHDHFCVWIDVGENFELGSALGKVSNSFLKPSNEQTKELLFSGLEQLHSVFESENNFSKTTALFSLLDILVNKSCEKNIGADDLPIALQNVLNYMNDNFAQIKYINEIQKKFFISSATLNRWFKQYINLSPREFLEAKKLGLAEQLLQKGFSVTETAESAGFSDTSHFITVFKKKFGKTPLKYKQM